MENLKTDLRVLKTKRAIRQAFNELLSEKHIDEITVSDIAKTAMINRKTFYAHYAGVHEIIAEIEDEIISAMQALLSQMRFERILECPYDLFQYLMQAVDKEIEIYGRLLTLNGNSNLILKIIQMMRSQLVSSFENDVPIDKQTFDLTISFMFAGILAVFTEWYNTGMHEPIEELSKKLSRLCISGIQGIMNNP